MKEKYRNTETDTTGHRMDSGSIIVTLSEASLSNLRADLLAYAAAKKSTQWIMESLAVSLAPYNIRVKRDRPRVSPTTRDRRNSMVPTLRYERM